MAAKYQLHYFNLSTRAELIRLVFAYGRVPLEEVTVPIGRPLMSLKPSFPFQQLPVLEVDGKKYAQSAAIARYMAKQVGLYPLTDHLKALEVDMAVNTTADIIYAVVDKNFDERDPERKAKQTARLNKYILPGYLNGLEQRIPTTKPFFLGDQVSLADLAIFHIIHNLLMDQKDEFPMDLDKFPKLLEVTDNIQQIPTIAEYLADVKNHRPIRPTW